jgi:hypothetical protein
MAAGVLMRTPRRAPSRETLGTTGRVTWIALVWAVVAVLGWDNRLSAAAPQLPFLRAEAPSNPYQADTSAAARKSAVQSIPFERLDADAQAKVRAVLSDASVFRRMPAKVVDCDPSLYLFLVQHPDVVANIWEVLRISRLQLRQIEGERYRVVEPAGTEGQIEFLYRSHDTHVIYGEGTYEGPLFARPVRGRTLVVLKSGYVRETNGRHYVTARLDVFLSIDHLPAEILSKAFHPLLGNVADVNFVQSVAFVGSLSRTAELKHRSVQRLAARLEHVEPALRGRLAELAGQIARQSPDAATPPPEEVTELATRPDAAAAN